jgi:hypothetical protein
LQWLQDAQPIALRARGHWRWRPPGRGAAGMSDYFDIAGSRIEEAQRQGDMFRDAVT